jgi:hypothetical protein
VVAEALAVAHQEDLAAASVAVDSQVVVQAEVGNQKLIYKNSLQLQAIFMILSF